MNAPPGSEHAYDTRARRRSLVILLVLVAITLGYLALDTLAGRSGAYRASSVVTTIAIALALVKVRLIFREFMQVRNAPALLRRITDLWVLLIGAALLGGFIIGLSAR